MNAIYDIIVIGAGPAGLTAALYAARAGKSVLLIEKETFGGQITYSPKVENYPGIASMSGNEFAERLLDQVTALGVQIEMGTVCAVKQSGREKHVLTEEGETYAASALIIAAGSHHRKLGIPGEEALIGRGISFCAVCDGAFYRGREIALIGGGNTALQEAILLSEGCKKVTIVQNLAALTGEARLAAALAQRTNVEVLTNTVVEALRGEDALQAIIVRNTDTEERKTLKVDGMFVAIGQQPENTPFAEVVTLEKDGYIAAGEDTITDSAGIFAAGDCRAKRIRQITTATADGTVAALAACRYLETLANEENR